MNTCSVVGCDEPAIARGWCQRHYHRWRHNGDPLIGGPFHLRGDTPKRFWSKVNKLGPIPAHRPELGPCWVWTGTILKDKGYGVFYCDGLSVKAHRWAFEDAHGPIPDGLEPDHLCSNEACVKAIANEQGPAHLEAVTPRVNILRSESPAAQNARKTHCIHGHEFTPENTYTWHGKRKCRTCQLNRDHLKAQDRRDDLRKDAESEE